MRLHYAAYGLQLNCSFPMPGMESVEQTRDSLPLLSLEQIEAAELESSWSAAGEPPEWRGRLGDGRDLTIERGVAGDRLFRYADPAPSNRVWASFHHEPARRRLACAPHAPGLDWQRVLIGKVLPSISVMLGYEALHAAAVDSPHGVVAIMAPSGSGKSTLAAELISRGWPLFADDQLTLDHGKDAVRAYAGTPHMNLAQNLATTAEPPGRTLGILGGERWVVASPSTTEPRPVALLCLLERAPELALESQLLDSNPLVLAPYMLGLSMDPERQRSRFALFADLIESATLIRLTASLDHRPNQIADLVEQALSSLLQSATGAIR